MNKFEDFISSCPYCEQPVTASDVKQRFCPNCGEFLLCAYCRQPVTKIDKELGKCPHCDAPLTTFEREAELAELAESDKVRRGKFQEDALKSLTALTDRLSKKHFERILAVSDEEWETAEKSDRERERGATTKKERPHGKYTPPPQKKVSVSRKPEEIEMICPLCGHSKVKRYPYQHDGWQYVCQGCKCAFDPELEQ